MRLAAAIAIACALAGTAAADRVDVKVVDIAGGLVYVDRGRRAGIVPGTRIRFGRVELVVVEATEKTAALERGGAAIAIGAAGIADATPGAAATVRQLPKPRPPEAFREQWPPAVVPASRQSPAEVPLGSARAPGRAHVAVIGHGHVAADRAATQAQAEARVIAAFDVLRDRPLAADVDLTGRVFRDGANGGERVPVIVRAAQLRYGAPDDPRFALGRLRYAASSLGMLDGARASARLGRIEIAGFGGLVPDPISGKPDTSASRFGGELIYDALDEPWRPRVALGAYASTWDGKLDERRLALTASAGRASWWLDGWAEAQLFDSDNPWGAHAIELVGAGATARWRKRGNHVGADLTYLRPERSLRLAAALPADWLCTGRPGVTGEPCAGGDSWASASLVAGTRSARWSVDAIGSVGRTNGVAIDYDSSGYVGAEVRTGPGRLLASIAAGRTSFASWTSPAIGGGFALSRNVDVAARYRPELLDFRAATEVVVLHEAVLDLHVVPARELDAVVSAVGTSGASSDRVVVVVTLAWRPLP